MGSLPLRQAAKIGAYVVKKELSGGKYPLVLIPYNGLMHFHQQEQQLEVLRRLRDKSDCIRG